MSNQLDWQSEGFPTEPGWYVVKEWCRREPICLHWAGAAAGQRDWRRGAQKVRVEGFYGPLPARPKPEHPEL